MLRTPHCVFSVRLLLAEEHRDDLREEMHRLLAKQLIQVISKLELSPNPPPLKIAQGGGNKSYPILTLLAVRGREGKGFQDSLIIACISNSISCGVDVVT